MARWLLPALFVAGQLLFWPGLDLLRGDPVPALPAAGVTASCLLVGAALGWRRERPVPAFAVVLAGGLLAAVAAPAGQQWLVTHDAALILGCTGIVALFSVAVHRPVRVTLWAYAALVAGDTLISVVQDGLADLPITVVLALVLDGLAVALGRRRARWNAERAAAARRLAAARREEREAADTERRRLARELHDVTAHHLTSIVVNSSAAQMLGEQRPDLRSAALDFAAGTGRETLDALRRLVALMPVAATPDEVPALTDLTDGFRALGQRITLDLPDGDPPPDRAGAVYGIVREALTNTLRYAPGGEVLVRCTTGDLVIEDDGTGPGEAAAGLGGGRGITGMRERAQSIGGLCTAGPRTGGGWRVRVEFPEADAKAVAAYPWLRSRTAIDVALVALLLMVPLALAVGEGLTPAATVSVLVVHVAHTVPLLWRRQAAWWVLGATALTGLLGPLLVAVGVVPAGTAWIFLFSVSEFAVAWAVAAWAGRPGLTWLAVPGVAVPWAFAFTLVLAQDQSAAVGGPAGPLVSVVLIGVFTPIAAILLAIPVAAFWGGGVAVRRRREGRREREENGVAAALEQAALRARAERRRIATGLHEAVLRHAADVPGAAERGDLAGVLGAARQALTAMRSLLDGLGPARAEEAASSRSE